MILYGHLWKNAPLNRNVGIIDLKSICAISGRCTPAPASNVETTRIDRYGIICGPEPAPRLACGRHLTALLPRQSCDLILPFDWLIPPTIGQRCWKKLHARFITTFSDIVG